MRATGWLLVSFLFGGLSAQAAASDFDMQRYSTEGEGRFETFHVSASLPLKQALADKTVGDVTELLIVHAGERQIALIKDQMAFHHIAQGELEGKDWMATF